MNSMEKYKELLEKAKEQKISCDDFEEFFKPIINKESEEAFQFYGSNWDELQKLAKEQAEKNDTKPYQHIWAVVDGDGPSCFYLNGRHVCNVMHHIVCKTPWGEGLDSDKHVYIEAEY